MLIDLFSSTNYEDFSEAAVNLLGDEGASQRRHLVVLIIEWD